MRYLLVKTLGLLVAISILLLMIACAFSLLLITNHFDWFMLIMGTMAFVIYEFDNIIHFLDYCIAYGKKS
jgi:hypothetical protein